MGTLKVLFFPVGGPSEVRDIENSLSALQELVGGSLEVMDLGHGFRLVAPEDGFLSGFPWNRVYLPNGLIIQGDFCCLRASGEQFASIADEDIPYLTSLFSD